MDDYYFEPQREFEDKMMREKMAKENEAKLEYAVEDLDRADSEF